MAVSVRLVAVGGAGTEPGAEEALALALDARGLSVESRAWVAGDEAACDLALAPGAALTVVVASGAGAEGDVVRRAVARAAGLRLVLNDHVLSLLEERYRRLDRPVPRASERQALLPQGAAVWDAGDGEAGWVVESAGGVVVVLPRAGDPGEALDRYVVPLVRARLPELGAVVVRTLRTAGVTLADLEERLGGAPLGGETTARVVPGRGEAWVRIRARGAGPEAATAAADTAEAALRDLLGDDCYGCASDTLEVAIGQLLLARGMMLSVAESCTGGLLGDRLTDVPGSSAYFERGLVVYSNRAKQELLGVPEDILRAHGAVSAPCAEAMVRGLAARTGSDCGLAITGIAGPDGGSAAKPVGTVFIGVGVRGEVEARRYRFAGGRRAIKWQSAQTALDLLRRRLLRALPR